MSTTARIVSSSFGQMKGILLQLHNNSEVKFLQSNQVWEVQCEVRRVAVVVFKIKDTNIKAHGCDAFSVSFCVCVK